MPKPAFRLTNEQKAVVAHRGGHLQVIACAGAGKTEAISRRVTSLIEEGADPGQIIAFTFTERSAESLKTRITRRIAEKMGEAYLDRLNPMYIGTIHAFCLRMLTNHVPEFGNYDIRQADSSSMGRPGARKHLEILEDESSPVVCYARNEHLGLVIPYDFMEIEHSYTPDFLVRLANGLQLLLEVKGYEVHNPEVNEAKYGADRKWVTAVNNLGDFGRWEFVVCKELRLFAD